MASEEIALMAHLMRRAGFGAAREELEERAAAGYEATVEELLKPGDAGNLPDDLIMRFQPEIYDNVGGPADNSANRWLYRMLTTRAPLEEKIALFWHGLFATSYVNQPGTQYEQIAMFRRYGLGSFRGLLVQLSRDPAMVLWLNTNENHRGAINENYGRELLELFSMGVGHYSEHDIKEAARAFTGWTIGNSDYMTARALKNSIWPYGRIGYHFQYDAEDHDDGEKTFLGETGRFNGEDIVDIVVRQPATAQFIARRLFQFFGADEVDEDGEQVIAEMCDAYFDSGYEIRSLLQTLFLCEYFKSEKARFARVKGPVELIVGALRLAGRYRKPTLGAQQVAAVSDFMGQALLVPPSVEGWHEGTEWVDSGALMERVNFAAAELGNTESPGVQAIIERLAASEGGVLSPDEVVDGCLDLLGPLQADEEVRDALVEHVAEREAVDLRGPERSEESERRVAEVLRLVASTPEFQMA